jgi:ABC-2 type transport system ATP-binding protein
MTTSNKVIARISCACKSFNKCEVLKNISIQIESSIILGLIGPSGAGKTTTIRCLMGMEKLDQGYVEVFDVFMPNRKILQRIGYMGQSDALYENLTAKENLFFFGTLMGLNSSKLRQAVKKNMALVKLSDFTNQLVSTYSSGMKRRLSLAITLLSNPDLIVLDEPTVGIDPSLRLDIWKKLRFLANNEKAIIVTTHVMDEAEKCDQVGLIINGKLLAIGTPCELKHKFNVHSIEEVFLKAEVSTS